MRITGRTIRKTRRAQGLTLKGLAKKVGGISFVHLSRIERGESATSLETLTKIARVLGLK